MITHSESITKLMNAIHQVQSAVDGVAKDSVNPHFKNRYASLENVIDTLRAPCLAAGLTIMQSPGMMREGALMVSTIVTHAASGEWLKSEMELPLAKQDPQGVGSATTYGCRYSLMALFCLPPVDDDGNAASREGPIMDYNTARPTGRQTTLERTGKKSAHQARNDKDWEWAEKALKEATSLDQLREWYRDNRERLEQFPENWRDEFQAKLDGRVSELKIAEQNMLAAG